MTNEELLTFLESMTPSPVQIDSILDSAWKAHRKAEKLNDQTLFSQLKDIILSHPGKRDRELRRNAYFLLGKLLQKHMDIPTCQFFIDCLEKETDRYVLSAMLTGIAQLHLPPEIQIDGVIRCSRSDKWLIRHSAIQALCASATEVSRDALRYWVRQEDEKAYKYELIYAQASLGYIGKAEDISLLQMHTRSRIRDVKDSASYAIENIQKRYL